VIVVVVYTAVGLLRAAYGSRLTAFGTMAESRKP
jgi:hypothetical protein